MIKLSELVNQLRCRVPKVCHANRCAKHGCDLSMHKLHSEKAIIDMDCRELQIPSDHPRCDYIFVGSAMENKDGNFLALIEMKRGNASAGELCKQLKAGAEFAQEQLTLENMDFQFLAVAVYGGKVHKDEINRLRKKQCRIPFRGARHEIKLVRSGSPLATALR